MDLERSYILFLIVFILMLSVAATAEIDKPAQPDDRRLSSEKEEFINRMYGNTVSKSSQSSNLEIETREGKTYVYPESANVSKFEKEIFDAGITEKKLYEDIDSFEVVLTLETPIYSGSKSELPDEILKLEKEGLLEIRNILKSSDSVSVSIGSKNPGEAFKRLNEEGSVSKGFLDTKVEALNLDANSVVGAGDARQSSDVNGSGEKLAVLDTGVEASHIDFSPRLVEQTDFSGDGTGDRDGHGTHVAGTALGDGSAEGGYYPGISQNGSLMSIKVLGDDGFGSSTDIQNGIEHAADNDASVISMSLGGSNGESILSNYNDSVQYARNKGSVVVAAAGNAGSYESVKAPGSVPDIITVGAVYDNENLAYFSSKGPESVYYSIKPEVTAPGYEVNSTSKDYPSTNYTNKSGTSMATPVVSGVIGLVMEQNPGWSVDEVENAVIASGEGNQVGDGKNVFQRGTGVINASKALDPELILSETRFNFGNISSSQKHSRVITLENPTSQQKNYTMSSEIHMYNRSSGNVESGDQASITFNQSSVAIPAGESKDLEIYLEIDEEYSEPYGGLVRFEDEEDYGILVGGYTNNISQLNADVSINASSIDVDDSVQANGSNSTDPEGDIQSYDWDMGDGASLSGEIVEHSYDSLGNYTINLTVEDGDTNQNSETRTVSVEDLQSPQADFAVNETSPEASLESVEFNASQSSDNVGISHYLWDLDDNGIYEKNITDTVIEKTYSTVGTRDVELKVVDTSGNSDTDNMDIDVQDTTSPYADLSVNSTSLNIDEDVEMDGSGSTDNTGIDSYSWSYDSKSVSTATVIDSFSSPGLYDVELNVSDSYGNYNATSITLNVTDVTDPETSISVDPKISDLGDQTNFSGSNSSDNVGIIDYRWDLNNDSSFEYTGVNVSENKDSPGNYSATLEVGDNSSNTDTASTWFYVNDSTPPDIELDVASDYPETGEEITLNASNSTDNDFVKSYDWDLDTTTVEDGGPSINHTYSSEGSYNITLNATDNSSNTASKNYIVDVKDFNGTIESPTGDTTGEKRWINASFTRNVSEINASLNSSDISLQQQNSTFYASKLQLNEQNYNLQIEANDTYSHQEDLSLNFTNSIRPEINGYNLSERLVVVNESIGFTSNITEDSYQNVTVKVERPNGTQKVLGLQNQSQTTNDTVIWNKSFVPEEEGNYSAVLNVSDTFGENRTSNKSFEVSKEVDFKLDVSGETPEFTLTDYLGSDRYQNTTENINSSIPSNSDWKASLKDTDSGSELKLEGLNISEDLSENITFEPGLQTSPDINQFLESETFSADIPLNYSDAEIKINHSGNVDEAYRCTDWESQADDCVSDWSSVSNFETLNSTHAVLSIEGLSAYTFGYTEEDDEDDEDDGGDDSGGGSGGSGGFSSGSFSSDPELSVNESENRILISNIYEGHSIDFNSSGLPIIGLEFESEADNGSIEFTSIEPGTELSFASAFQASSNISGPYTLEFEVGSDWLEENRFQASEVSLYRNGSDGWEDQEADILEVLEDRTVYQAEVQDFSAFGIGVDRACYSTENVTAEADESCRTYRNPCEVPENADEVESCTSFEEEQQVSQEIEQKKQEVSDGEEIEKLAEAENLIEQGNITQARRMVQEVDAESEAGESRILIFLILSSAFAITGLTGYMVVRRRRKHQIVMEMAELVDMLKDLQSQGGSVRIPAMKLHQANEALQNENYSKAERKTERVKEHLKREL